MARRLRLPSWVEDEPKLAKPLEPLRYRISPNEKKLDQLDALEAELSKTPLEWDEWEYLQTIIDTKREKLAKVRERELGNAPAPAKAQGKLTNAPATAYKAHRIDFNSWVVLSPTLWPNSVKWALCSLLAAVIIF
jgi:hypothetical protein